MEKWKGGKVKKIIDIHGHLGNINFVPFWAADADKLAAVYPEFAYDVTKKKTFIKS